MLVCFLTIKNGQPMKSRHLRTMRSPVEEREESLYEQRGEDHDGETHKDCLPELVGAH